MEDKKILILGGSSGIGFTVAKQASQRGAHIIIASRNATHKKDELQQELSEEYTEFYDVDVRSAQTIQELFEDIGEIDHLVITVKPEVGPEPFKSTDIEDVKAAFDTKFWGAYQLIQTACPHISEHGSIILTSGVAGEKIYEGSSTVGIISGATETLGRFLAVELAPIRVNIVSPGFVEPKPEPLEEMAQQFPAGRLASSEEIASEYLRLMENEYVTGTVSVVDGGATLM